MQAPENTDGMMVQLPGLEPGTSRSTIGSAPHGFVGSWNVSPENPPKDHLPDDFCRTCSGKGYLTDYEYRPGVGRVSVSERCWACDGTGWGK